MEVLVVDDDSLSRRAVVQTFQSAGYCVSSATNGQEALVRMSQDSFQLVV